MVLLLSLPALALRDPRFEVSKGASAKYSMLFMLLGIVALPMWVPQVGQLVLTFTVALPGETPRLQRRWTARRPASSMASRSGA
jgi:hypothetical protein